MDFALLWDGIPTRRSTSPTLMSWRRKSSSRKVSSANEVSTVGPRIYLEYLPLPLLSSEEYLKPAQTTPEKLVRAKSQQVVKFPNPGKKIPAEHFDGNASLVLPQVQLHGLRR